MEDQPITGMTERVRFFVQTYLQSEDYLPTLLEIALACGLGKSGAEYHCHKGHIPTRLSRIYRRSIDEIPQMTGRAMVHTTFFPDELERR